MSPDPPIPVAYTTEYISYMGIFWNSMAGAELTIDYAIYKFLEISAEETHLLTAGMMFGKKARLLADLIKRSTHPNKPVILQHLNKLRGDSLRDVFAHSYIHTDSGTVTFIERRDAGGTVMVREHPFTIGAFIKHVADISDAAVALYAAVVESNEDVQAFSQAALNLASKSTTSPGIPPS